MEWTCDTSKKSSIGGNILLFAFFASIIALFIFGCNTKHTKQPTAEVVCSNYALGMCGRAVDCHMENQPGNCFKAMHEECCQMQEGCVGQSKPELSAFVEACIPALFVQPCRLLGQAILPASCEH